MALGEPTTELKKDQPSAQLTEWSSNQQVITINAGETISAYEQSRQAIKALTDQLHQLHEVWFFQEELN